MANPKGIGGFQDHPELINKQGAPKRGQSWGESIKRITDMTREEAIAFVGAKTRIGRALKELSPNMPIKDALIFASIIAYGRDPNAKMLGVLMDREEGKAAQSIDLTTNSGASSEGKFSIPADMLAPSFTDAYRDIVNKRHTEYIFKGGRGSTKSSFISEIITYLVKNNPTMHALITRQIANTMRDSVYSQMQWAISELGVSDQFKFITSPLEIEYLPTGQKIYFRGFDDPGKIKSIKPAFGYLGILWIEEADQIKSAEAIRKVEQSLRGGDEMYFFKSFNPPRSAQNWINKYVKTPKENQYQHTSNYLTVPHEWLGQVFLDEAEHLKNVNPTAYANEYLGEVTGTGGLVFENVTLREITEKDIEQFDRVYHGMDWGFAVDPAHYSRVHFDAARRTLYVFGEVRKWKTSNEELYKSIVKYGYSNGDLLVADSAEPKSVADFRQYGANCRGAEKGKDSVRYSMRWLENLTSIVIDPKRCPYTAEEFINYEYEQNSEGEYISEYQDRDNHSIDSIRYALNTVWRRRGE